MTLLESSIKNIINNHSDFFLNKKNVVGIALGYKYTKNFNTNALSLHVLVQNKIPLNELYNYDLIPKSFFNIPTDVIEVGELQHFNTPPNTTNIVLNNLVNGKYAFLKGKCNTIQAGYSIGPGSSKSSGTIGAIVFNNNNNKPYILSNNQVLAMSNKLEIGTPIVQPGFIDATFSNFRVIGKLYKFVPLVPRYTHLGETNRNVMDCALATIDTKNFKYTNEIYGIGKISGTITPNLNTLVKKCGRSTGITNGHVKSINAKVIYHDIAFKDQILCSPIASTGDSGSLVVDNQKKAIGLLHIGAVQGTFISPIDPILKIFNIHF